MKYTNYIHCLHSVWVFIQSPMFLSAPEGQFIKRLPKNGQFYQNCCDLAVGFVQYPHCICFFAFYSSGGAAEVTNAILILDKSNSQIITVLINLAILGKPSRKRPSGAVKDFGD